METYHRKRSRRGSTIEAANNEMISLNRKETCSVLHGPQAPLARQPLLDHSYEVSDEEVELGSVYEVNHTNLPPRTPAQLRSTRVVMVSEKTDLNVAIRYPSVSSLKTYFGCGITEMYPALDEKFVMGIKLARKVLKRQVPSQEFAEKKHLEGFWLVKNNTQSGSKVVLKNEDIGLAQELKKKEMVRWGVRRQVMYIGRQKEIPKIPSTSSLVQGKKEERKNQHEINGDEDEYVEVELEDDVDIADKEENDAEVETDHEENGSQAEADKEENEVEAETDKEENDVEAETDKEENDVEAETDKEENDVEAETDKEENDVEAEADKEENEVEAESDKEENEVEADHESDQEEDEVETKPKIEEKINDKKPKTVRKMKCTRNLRKRKAKQTNQLWQVTKKRMKKGKKSAMTDPSNRWSKERYMAAELSLLEAMKAKKAMIGNPITRPALRLEARKRIGDTGLLDHLLKHVANEVAPGGKLRFRRSHNASGTMEYWLEDADLLKIRKDAGVKDPFWTPPPGWKPGDSPIQDPIVAKELNNLKEELAYMKKEFLPKKVIEEELARIRSEFDVLTSKFKEDQSQAIVVSDFVDTSPKQVMDFCNFLLTSESQTTDDVDNSMISKEKSKKPVLVISDFLKKMQAWTQAVEVGKQTTQMEATSISQTVSNAQKHSESPILTEDEDKNEAAVALAKQPSADSDQETSDAQKQEQPAAPPEGKAAKIERLKSGFRLCRPQGTFLWPNMVKKPTSNMSSSSQVEDHFVVPTPPSVNSSTEPQLPYFSHHHLLNLASPVKPVPEKRPLTVTISAVSHPQTTSRTPNLINLNDIPTNPSTTIKLSNLLSSEMKNDHSWEAYGAIFPAAHKKRKISSSSPSASSDAPLSCFSNTTPSTWVPGSGGSYKQRF